MIQRFWTVMFGGCWEFLLMLKLHFEQNLVSGSLDLKAASMKKIAIAISHSTLPNYLCTIKHLFPSTSIFQLLTCPPMVDLRSGFCDLQGPLGESIMTHSQGFKSWCWLKSWLGLKIWCYQCRSVLAVPDFYGCADLENHKNIWKIKK